MTVQEVKNLLAAIQSSYPSFKPIDPQDTLKLWAVVLEPYDYELISSALITRIRTTDTPFAPAAGELIGIANRFTEDEPDEAAIVDELRRATRNGTYGAEEEFEKLSPIAKQIVHSPSTIRQWAQITPEEIETVLFSFVKKRIPVIKQRKQEQQSLDPRQIELITKVTGKLTQKAREAERIAD